MHFEIPVNDSERMSRFYTDLFDWKFDKQPMGSGMDYWMIETTGRGPEHLGGGMYLKQGSESDRPRFFIGVEDIDEHTERFKQAGGSVIIEKQEVPGFGWSVIGSDPEGNVLGLFQPLQPAPQTNRTQSTAKRRRASTSSRKTKRKAPSRSSKKRKK